MVSHGREKQDNATGKSKKTSGKTARKKKSKDSNADPTYDDDIRDMDLPDDFSIAGTSMVSSEFGGSNFGGEEDDLFEGGDDDNDVDNTKDPSNRAEYAAQARQAKLLDALSLSSTLTSEKRATKREGGYRVLFKAITQYASGSAGQDILQSRWSGLLESCLYSIRGGGSNSTPAEQYAACRVLEASAVILGEDHDEIVLELNDALKKVINATGRATQVRIAALRCLSMVHFICGTHGLEEGEDVVSVLELCEKLCGEKYRGEKVSPSLRASALDCWSLLSSTLPDVKVAGGASDDEFSAISLGRGLELLSLLASCLESTDVGLRSSAGECVTLIHECRLNLGLDDDDAENATERRFRRGSWDGSEWEILMDEVKQRIAELSVESGHHMSKKSKKQQRSTFRDFMSTIVDDEPPEEVVTFRGGSVKVTSWKEIVQLNFIRHCLQGGFQIQMMMNETLHEIFGVDGSIISDATGMAMSQLEKRLTMSKTSDAAKKADKKMNRQRKTRTNVKNHFLTADGEDI
mmetsp:Transcript_22302/g.45703  ORF Transcript_22302/g.45703 Transcript_22302/m.45703 type:complete len:521 (+) Transcript_22302:139-1701(+)